MRAVMRADARGDACGDACRCTHWCARGAAAHHTCCRAALLTALAACSCWWLQWLMSGGRKTAARGTARRCSPRSLRGKQLVGQQPRASAECLCVTAARSCPGTAVARMRVCETRESRSAALCENCVQALRTVLLPSERRREKDAASLLLPLAGATMCTVNALRHSGLTGLRSCCHSSRSWYEAHEGRKGMKLRRRFTRSSSVSLGHTRQPQPSIITDEPLKPSALPFPLH
jgi:hypothetical protein